MSATIVVIGGGITGRLVQLALPRAQVFDWGAAPVGKPALTRNWGANYLWAPIPGVRCEAFPVVTHVDGDPATHDSILAYKTKIGKAGEPRDQWGLQFQEHTTGYDFVELPPATITYGHRAVEIVPERQRVVWANGMVQGYDYLISTIPLFSLLGLTGEWGADLRRWTDGHFACDPIYVRAMPRPPDAPCPPETLYVNYLTDCNTPAYRYCDRNGERHYEGLTPMGTIPNKKLFPGKIHSLEEERSHGVHEMLHRSGIWCFGRYATWDSDELVHQTWLKIAEFAGCHA